MISAREANLIRESVIKDKKKIMKVLDYIDSKIRECAGNGGDSILIKIEQLVNLNDWQIDAVLNELKAYGYNVSPNHDLIELGIIGYTIRWDEDK
jgi:hypothetical protein